jgi:hypothetical protein
MAQGWTSQTTNQPKNGWVIGTDGLAKASAQTNLMPSRTYPYSMVTDGGWETWAGYQDSVVGSLPLLPDVADDGGWAGSPDGSTTVAPELGVPSIDGFDWALQIGKLTKQLTGAFDGLMWPFRAFASFGTTVTP